MKFLRKMVKNLFEKRVFGTRIALLFLVFTFVLFPRVVFAFGEGILPTSDTIFVLLASIIMGFVNFLGLTIALITEVVLVNVMSYNGFATSPVVGAGWAVVRDVMNMGFVVVLLIIAVVTIFGGQVGSWSVKWTQQLPKLLLFAILINFSRMICSLVIDIGQVIMLTFANAIKDIAGGNIIQVFGLGDFVTMDRDAIKAKVTAGDGTGAVSLFTSALLALVMTLIVLGTMVILTVILIYRIVTLWVLVVISPLAFFFGGAEVLSKGAGDVYGDWWKKFSGAVVIGPVLVFFLWLTLSVAGNGNIAATESFPMGAPSSALGDVGNVTGFNTRIAEPGRLLSFIIGIGMMFVGFEAAQKFATSVPGAAGLLKGGVMGALKVGAGTAAVAGVAANAGLIAGVYGGKKIGGKGLQMAGKTKAGQNARGWAGKGLVALGTSKWVPGFVGRSVARVGTSLEQTRKEDAAKRHGEEVEKVKGYDVPDIRAGLEGNPMSTGGVAKQNALRWKVLTSQELRGKFDKSELDAMVAKFKENGGVDAVEGDDKLNGDWKKFKKARPDLLDGEDKAKVLKKMENEDFKEVDDAALHDPAVMAELETRKEWDREGGLDGKGGEMSLDKRMEKGRYGNRLQKAMEKIRAGDDGDIDPETVTSGILRNLPEARQTETNFSRLNVEQMKVVLENPNLNMGNLPENYVRNQAADIAQTVTPEKIQELAQGRKGDAFREGLNNELSTDFMMSNGKKQELRMALIMSKKTGSGLSGHAGYNAATDTFDDGGDDAFETALESDSGFLRNYQAEIDRGGAIAKIATVKVDMGQLIEGFRHAPAGEQHEWQDIIQSLHDQIVERLTDEADSLSIIQKQKMTNRMRQARNLLGSL